MGWERAGGEEFEPRYQAIAASKGALPDADRLHQLFELDWAYTMASSPESATFVGVRGYDAKWTDWSRSAIDERTANLKRPLAVLTTIDRGSLSPGDRVSYDLFRRQGEEAMAAARFPFELLQVSQLGGVHQDAAQVFTAMDGATVAGLETQIARLRALPAEIDQVLILLADGLKRGITPPQITLRDVPAQVAAQIPEDPFTSPLLLAFAELPPTISGEAGERLRLQAAAAYRNEVQPAFQKLGRFLTETYIPAARTTTGMSALPEGEAWYDQQIRTHTSTSLTARQIHDIGLAEVKRIRLEMERVKKETGFAGSMSDFFHHLRTDPKFFFTNRDDLLRAYRDIAKRADPQLTKLFRTLPRMTYGVQAVPAYAEKSQTTAYYYSGSTETGRPGYFFANTFELETRPKWEMESLTLHEAVPGHHLQISLAQEMGELPAFRRWGGYTAFVEGWGLYAESLGEEMGFYTDPYSKFGQLTYEMWRAVRLVVDTGMHALGWTRQQAIDYFLENAGKSKHDIVVEIDRYLVMPGQALAYKLGELKIKELRAYATAELAGRFDVRAFHDEVLRHGAVPLSGLDEHLRRWVTDQKQSP